MDYAGATEVLVEVLLPIGLLIVVAKLFEGVLGRLGLSSIIAFTLTGVALGPVTGLVEPTHDLQLFLEIGIYVLFFIVGLDEIDVPGFVTTIRGRYFAAAIISVVISLLAALVVTSDLFGLDLGLDLEFNESLALAGVLSLSSLGLVARVLSDSGTLKQPIGLKIFTIVIIAEIASLLVVGFTIGEYDHSLNVVSVLFLVGEMTGFVVLAWVLSAKVLPVVIVALQRVVNVPQLSFGLLIGGLFLVVVAAEEMELHGTIGALLFGAALSGLSQGVRNDIMPGMLSASEGLFVPLFFASAGLHLDLSFTDLPAGTVAGLVLVPLVGKFAGAFIGTYVTRIDAPFALATGLMSKGVAEIAFLLVLLESGVIDQAVFSLLVVIMFGYIVLMPSVINFAVGRTTLAEHPTLPDSVPPSFARYALEGVKVHAVLDRTRTYPGSGTPVAEFKEAWTMPNQIDYLVVDDGEVSGIVSVGGLRSLRRGLRAKGLLRDIMRDNTLVAWPDEPIGDVLERMTNASQSVVPVMDRQSDRFVGSVTSHDVIDLVVLMDEIEAELSGRQAQADEP